MRLVAWGWLGLLVFAGPLGCGDDCVQAGVKLADECNAGSGASIDSEIRQCDSKTLCRAQCVLKFDCALITAPPKDNAYVACVGECAKK